ncbi:MAG: exodeoxyribonuclease VII large subunit [Christensenellaceae bacterium]|jgi:exodeoxyribonuclease VII large subunit
MDELVLSVSQLNKYVADKLTDDPLLSEVWVRGEVSGLNLKYSNIYFALKDEEAVLDCMLGFDSEAAGGYAEELQEGRTVFLRGQVSVYFKSGRYRMFVKEIRFLGMGEIAAAFRELKERLERQGVFDIDKKKPLPQFPKTVGIVTSKNGAAIHDIRTVTYRRNPSLRLVLYPARVQGEGAAAEIVRGINYFNERADIDVLIVGRGGGSAEDLLAFNDEQIVLAAYHSRIPIISAVGHESDYTLLDLAADFRAPTPSAAAELVSPSAQAVLEEIRQAKQMLGVYLRQAVQDRRAALAACRGALSRENIRAKAALLKTELSAYKSGIQMKAEALCRQARMRYTGYKDAIYTLSPISAFKRGYSVALTKDGKELKSARDVRAGDTVTIVLEDGSVLAEVRESKLQKKG